MVEATSESTRATSIQTNLNAVPNAWPHPVVATANYFFTIGDRLFCYDLQ